VRLAKNVYLKDLPLKMSNERTYASLLRPVDTSSSSPYFKSSNLGGVNRLVSRWGVCVVPDLELAYALRSARSGADFVWGGVGGGLILCHSGGVGQAGELCPRLLASIVIRDIGHCTHICRGGGKFLHCCRMSVVYPTFAPSLCSRWGTHIFGKRPVFPSRREFTSDRR
jgi:hypothetical protein